jgi:prepilin-type N-terminal cleavage/methylation domain-containing protein
MVRRQTHRGGLTLVECMIATGILSVAVLAVSEAIVAGHAHSRTAVQSAEAADLASTLMEEILALPYHDPQGPAAFGPDAGESTRLQFDNCDDFHGLGEEAGALHDALGTLLPSDLQNYARSVTAAYTTLNVTGLGSVNGLNVQVRVTDGAQTWTINRFIPEPPID